MGCGERGRQSEQGGVRGVDGRAALGAIGKGDMRTEWDGWDLDYRGVRVEVKASGLSQGWDPDRHSIPRFDIAPRKWSFRPDQGGWVESVPPARIADLYVFCLHKPVPATNENICDPTSWEFWVISKQTLDNELGAQKTVGLTTLGLLSAPVGHSGLEAGVDAIAPAN